MARKYKKEVSTGNSVLLIDDNLEYLEATKKLIQREGHNIVATESALKALEIVKEQFFDVILVDFFMPEMSGENFIIELRKFNTLVQVILQTGYSSENPPREMLKRLDIQGYFDKSEGPDKLLLWLDVGISAAKTTQFLYKSRESLNYILNVTPDLHKIQPLEDLLKGILIQVMSLIGVSSSFLAVLDGKKNRENLENEESFLATVEDEENFIIQAATGHFKEKSRLSNTLEKDEYSAMISSLHDYKIKTIENKTYVPLVVAEQIIGIIYIDHLIETEQDIKLLNIFANQAAVAIHNSQLYKFATVDPLTNVYVRGYTLQCLAKELRNALRNRAEHALMVIDLDDLKVINDKHGHIAGDRALSLLGQCLRESTRLTDIIGRYGGDEFLVLLPKSDKDGTQLVLTRIYDFLSKNVIKLGNKEIKINCSIGVTVIDPPDFDVSEMEMPIPQLYYEKMSQLFIEEADKALYKSKSAGKGRYMFCEKDVKWFKNVKEAEKII